MMENNKYLRKIDFLVKLEKKRFLNLKSRISTSNVPPIGWVHFWHRSGRTHGEDDDHDYDDRHNQDDVGHPQK